MKKSLIIGVVLGMISCLIFSACAAVEERALAIEIYHIEENMEKPYSEVTKE